MSHTTNNKTQHIPGHLEIGHTTPLKTTVWKVRRHLRKLTGKDVLNPEQDGAKHRKKVRHVYRRVDEFTAAFFPRIVKPISKKIATTQVRDMIDQLGYKIVEKDETKPWGAYYRLSDTQTEQFIEEFFPGLTLKEAKLGKSHVKLSPKFLLVMPGQRLSWQYHHRRAERWHFMLAGAYYKSMDDKQGVRVEAAAGTVVQFQQEERHRLCADDSGFALVAEIWQHTDADQSSDEQDIIRLADDYHRETGKRRRNAFISKR